MEDRNSMQDYFGYMDNETVCADCGKPLEREDAHWSQGRWWHVLVSDCDENKRNI